MSINQYYTQPERARELLAEVRKLVRNVDLFVEPSAGAVVFLQYIPESLIGFDLEPLAPGIVKADFFDWQPPSDSGRIVAIGNLPFGQVGALASKFFNHAACLAEYIAFILPASFANTSMHDLIDRRFHLINQVILPDELFEKDVQTFRCNTVFQVWERRDVERALAKPETTYPDFEFVKVLEEAYFAVRRGGAHVGKIIDIPTDAKSRKGLLLSSNYYIRATGREVDVVRTTFAICELEGWLENAVSVPLISKAEIISRYDTAVCLLETYMFEKAWLQSPREDPCDETAGSQSLAADAAERLNEDPVSGLHWLADMAGICKVEDCGPAAKLVFHIHRGNEPASLTIPVCEINADGAFIICEVQAGDRPEIPLLLANLEATDVLRECLNVLFEHRKLKRNPSWELSSLVLRTALERCIDTGGRIASSGNLPESAP